MLAKLRYRINCLRGKHAMACIQEVVFADMIIKHAHACIDCPKRIEKADRPIPPELLTDIIDLPVYKTTSDISKSLLN